MHRIFVYGALRRYYLDTRFGKKGKNRFLYVTRTWGSWPLLGLEPSGNVIDSIKRDSVIWVWWQNNASWQDGSTTTRYISPKNVYLSSFWLVLKLMVGSRSCSRHHTRTLVSCTYLCLWVLLADTLTQKSVQISIDFSDVHLHRLLCPADTLRPVLWLKKPWFFETMVSKI